MPVPDHISFENSLFAPAYRAHISPFHQCLSLLSAFYLLHGWMKCSQVSQVLLAQEMELVVLPKEAEEFHHTNLYIPFLFHPIPPGSMPLLFFASYLLR